LVRMRMSASVCAEARTRQQSESWNASIHSPVYQLCRGHIEMHLRTFNRFPGPARVPSVIRELHRVYEVHLDPQSLERKNSTLVTHIPVKATRGARGDQMRQKMSQPAPIVFPACILFLLSPPPFPSPTNPTALLSLQPPIPMYFRSLAIHESIANALASIPYCKNILPPSSPLKHPPPPPPPPPPQPPPRPPPPSCLPNCTDATYSALVSTPCCMPQPPMQEPLSLQ